MGERIIAVLSCPFLHRVVDDVGCERVFGIVSHWIEGMDFDL